MIIDTVNKQTINEDFKRRYILEAIKFSHVGNVAFVAFTNEKNPDKSR